MEKEETTPMDEDLGAAAAPAPPKRERDVEDAGADDAPPPQYQRLPDAPQSINLMDYLAGENGGFIGFQAKFPKIANIFTSMKVWADTVHDFATAEYNNAYPFSELFKPNTGQITMYHSNLYKKFNKISADIAKGLLEEDDVINPRGGNLLQNILFGTQFNPKTSNAVKEKEFLKNILRHNMANYPHEMERSFTIIGYIVISFNGKDHDAAIEQYTKFQEMNKNNNLRFIYNWKGESNRVCIIRNTKYDAGKQVPIFIDVSTGKEFLLGVIFGNISALAIVQAGEDAAATIGSGDVMEKVQAGAAAVAEVAEGGAKWPPPIVNDGENGSNNGKTTIPTIVQDKPWWTLGSNSFPSYTTDPAPNITWPVAPRIPFIETQYLGEGEKWKVNMNACIDKFQNGLSDYFQYVLIPLITAEPFDDTTKFQLTIRKEEIVSQLNYIRNNPAVTTTTLEKPLNFTFDVVYGEEAFVFTVNSAGNGDNTITKISAHLITKAGSSNQFLSELDKFFDHVAGVHKNDLLDKINIRVVKHCFFFAIKGLGDWIQSNYNARIIMAGILKYPTAAAAAADVVQTGILQSVDKFVFGDAALDAFLILWMSNLKNNQVNEFLGIEQYINQSFIQFIDFKTGRYNASPWQKSIEKLKTFFPEETFDGLLDPIAAEKLFDFIENASRIFERNADDKLVITMPIYSDPITSSKLVTKIDYPSKDDVEASKRFLDEALGLLQLNFDYQKMNSEIAPKIAAITDNISVFYEKYDGLNTVFSDKYESVLKMIYGDGGSGAISKEIWKVLTAKSKLLTSCNAFFEESNLSEMLDPVKNIKEMSDKMKEQITSYIDVGYTVNNGNIDASITKLNKQKDKFTELIVQINDTLGASVMGQLSFAVRARAAKKLEDKEAETNNHPEVISIVEQLNKMLKKTITGFIKEDNENIIEYLEEKKVGFENENNTAAVVDIYNDINRHSQQDGGVRAQTGGMMQDEVAASPAAEAAAAKESDFGLKRLFDNSSDEDTELGSSPEHTQPDSDEEFVVEEPGGASAASAPKAPEAAAEEQVTMIVDGGNNAYIKAIIHEQQLITLALDNTGAVRGTGIVYDYVNQEVTHLELCFAIIDNIFNHVVKLNTELDTELKRLAPEEGAEEAMTEGGSRRRKSRKRQRKRKYTQKKKVTKKRRKTCQHKRKRRRNKRKTSHKKK